MAFLASNCPVEAATGDVPLQRVWCPHLLEDDEHQLTEVLASHGSTVQDMLLNRAADIAAKSVNDS